jgi:DNA-binding CsgD family transcriptional regulator
MLDEKVLKESAITFTQRESECLTQAMAGKSLSEIAENLKITQRSVCFYFRNIKIKLKSWLEGR